MPLVAAGDLLVMNGTPRKKSAHDRIPNKMHGNRPNANAVLCCPHRGADHAGQASPTPGARCSWPKCPCAGWIPRKATKVTK